MDVVHGSAAKSGFLLHKCIDALDGRGVNFPDGNMADVLLDMLSSCHLTTVPRLTCRHMRLRVGPYLDELR